jgi:hypothetical protein
METQNVTLAIPKEILQKAKLMAVQRHMSLSKLLTRTLEEMASENDGYEAARKSNLARLGIYDLGTNGKITWTRDELHERR